MNGKDRKDKQHIQVFARIRPFNEAERLHNAKPFMQVNGKEIVMNQMHGSKKFTFDQVFDTHSKQVSIYKNAISPIVHEVLKGYNCTVFAYGQTGSGKTHTMVGPELTADAMTFAADNDVGIIPRAMGHIFDCLSKEKELDYTIRVSYLEIYNEVLNDLLATDDKTLRIYEDPKNKSSVQIHGLEEVTVYSKADVYELLRMGSEKKKIAATYMNQQSSRSHSVFTITVHMKETTPEGEELVKTGKLNLVDLAGSENIQRSGAVDQRAREAGNINQSLLTLGRVIKALVDKAGHVPYRESKLTRILQDSLGGKTKTTIIATASPAISNFEETLSTLDYAYRARNIITKPEVNQRYCKTALIKGYLEEIDRLKKDLNAARKGEGFYLNAESYHSLLQENIVNKEEYLRAVKECAEFESRQAELQRRCCELEEVYSMTQNDLSMAKDTLAKSRTHLKHLRRDRHIRQELIDKYSETESHLFSTSKEISAAFDNHIKEHNTLRDKLDDFYESMQANENATDSFQKEQARIVNSIEDLNDQQHESLIRQLQDANTTTNEFVQQQQQCITNIGNASSNMVAAFMEALQGFSKHMEAGQQQRLQALEDNCNFSQETMQIIKEHIESENVRMLSGLDTVCAHMHEAKKAHALTFENWHSNMEVIKEDIATRSENIVKRVQSSLEDMTKRLGQFAADMLALQKPAEEAARERAALQKAFDAHMRKEEQLRHDQDLLLQKLSVKVKCLNEPTNAKWKECEDTMKQDVDNIKDKLDKSSAVVASGIEQANAALTSLPLQLQAIMKQNTVAINKTTETITLKQNTFATRLEEHKAQATEHTHTVCADLQNTCKAVTEEDAQFKKRLQDGRSNVTGYKTAHKQQVANVIDTVKIGTEVCSNSLAEMCGVVYGFVNNLHVVKPSGATPLHKKGLTYNIPRKVSQRVLQYNKDLDLSSISLLDESMDQNCGRPSLDFYEQSDEIEYQGQFITTEVPKAACKISLSSNGSEPLEPLPEDVSDISQ